MVGTTAGNEWGNLPTNRTDVKLKIVQLVLKMRKLGESDIFNLDQGQFIAVLSNRWGATRPSTTDMITRGRIRRGGIEQIDPDLPSWRANTCRI